MSFPTPNRFVPPNKLSFPAHLPPRADADEAGELVARPARVDGGGLQRPHVRPYPQRSRLRVHLEVGAGGLNVHAGKNEPNWDNVSRLPHMALDTQKLVSVTEFAIQTGLAISERGTQVSYGE